MEALFLDPFIILVIAGLLGFFAAWGIGANDVANAMGTSVGSKALTLKQAVLIAAIFEFLGAYLAGGEVTSTIRKGIVNPEVYQDNVDIFIVGMMATLLATGSWLLIASKNGWPVSTTHSIVGAIVGFVMITKGSSYVSWDKIVEILYSWVSSPLISAVLAFIIFRSVQKFILESENKSRSAIRLIPVYVFLVMVVIALVTAKKGLVHLGFDWSDEFILQISLSLAALVSGLAFIYLRQQAQNLTDVSGIEVAFSLLMVFAACAMAFAHGSNDVANAIGPLAAIVSVVNSNGIISTQAAVGSWVLLLGGVGIVFGLATYGHRVIKTVGEKITKLTPSFGFSANLATASTVVFASFLGFPVSTTHTLIGGVIGVGLANDYRKIDFKQIGTIVISWLVTVPVGALMTILYYVLLRVVFGV
ncbi:MAG: inorganic phosphate transporter [Gammaproteobacteria bacterium]|jgi:PiT family inorganic phosphate transporter